MRWVRCLACRSGDPVLSLDYRCLAGIARIVQCKMILKRDLIPMQDDTENGGGLTGELRPNARTYADRRDVESRSDQPVFGTGRHYRICRTEPRRKVRICAAIAGGARVCTARQEAARRHPRLPEQND